MKAVRLICIGMALAAFGQLLQAFAEAPEIVWTAQSNTNWAGALAFSPDSKYLVSGGRDKQVHIWNVSDGAPVRTLLGHSGDILAVAVSPDNHSIASASYADKSLRFWRLADGAQLGNVTLAVWPYTITFSPDGSLVAVGSGPLNSASQVVDRTDIYRVADGKLLRTLNGKISPDGRWRISVRYLGKSVPNDPRAYEASIWQSAASYWGSTNETVRFSIPWAVVTFSQDNSLLVASTPGAPENPYGSILKLYRVSDGAELRTLNFPSRGGLNNPITWIDGRTISPDNQVIGAISASTRVFDPGPYSYIALWDTASAELIKYYRDDMGVPAYGDTPLIFSPHGQFFAYTRGDGTVVLARAPVSVPALEINRENAHAIVSWNTPVSPWILESSRSLSGATWTAVEPLPVEIGGKQVVTVNMGTDPNFFRLRRL